MEAEVKLSGQVFRADLSAGKSIARTIQIAATDSSFNMGSPNAQSAVFRDGDFVGDVSSGGSCNVNVLKINPHCVGTHTETLMHLIPATEEKVLPTVDAIVPTGLQLALVLTLETSAVADVTKLNEKFTDHAGSDDRLVCAAAINTALANAAHRLPIHYAAWSSAETKSLILRISRDDPARATAPWSFDSDVPPYFTADAIELLNHQRVFHLLVEFPSIDRLEDGGQLYNHHRFWNVDQASKNLAEAWSAKTITEMVEIPASIKDGLHLLSIQVPPVRSDAMLSRPTLFELVD